MKVFNCNYLEILSNQAKKNPRQREYCNIHLSYDEPCQRLFNAIEPGSYIRPHRHLSDPKDEMLVAIRGLMALIIFDEQGFVDEFICFGSEKHGSDIAVGVEVSAHIWHTVVALEPGSILLEVKSGPFNPNQPKDIASWAPDENSLGVQSYLKKLIERVSK